MYKRQIIDKRAQEAVPWYVTADLNQYTEANKKRFYAAVELAARVQDFIDYDGPDRTGYAERYALGLGISPQSLYLSLIHIFPPPSNPASHLAYALLFGRFRH